MGNLDLAEAVAAEPLGQLGNELARRRGDRLEGVVGIGHAPLSLSASSSSARPDLAPARPARHARKAEDPSDPVAQRRRLRRAAGGRSGLEVGAHAAQPSIAAREQVGRIAPASRAGPARTASRIARPVAAGVGVGALARLGDDRVDDPELDLVLGGHPHRRGRGAGLVARAPQDRRRALGADDRVDRVLERQDDVADADGQGAARAALAQDDDDDRNLQARS